MDFAHLNRLWLLLLVPVLYLLARPPRAHQRALTAHLTQWRAALSRVRRQPLRFRRLRFWLLVLATLLLIGAAVQPTFGAEEGPSELAILFDGSASMLADGAREQALATVQSQLEDTPSHVRVRLVLCGREPRVIDVPEREIAFATLSTWCAEDLAFDAGVDLRAFASSVVSDEVQVLVVTDGLGVTPALQSADVPGVGVELVGRSQPGNLGIADCRIRDAWPLPFVDVTVSVVAARLDPVAGSEDRVDVELEIAPIAPDSDAVSPPVTALATCRFETDGAGVTASSAPVRLRRPRGVRGALLLRARLRPAGVGAKADDYAWDDVVQYVLPALPAPDVVLLSAAQPPSLRALAVAETLAELGGGRVVPPGSERAGFVVVNGGRLEALPKRAILFGVEVSSAAGSGSVGGGEARSDAGEDLFEPLITDWNRSDSLLRGIDLSGLRVSEARSLSGAVRAGAMPLIASDQGPLGVAVDRGAGGARTLWLGATLDQSNLALLPALPQLLGRAYKAAWGDEARVSAEQRAVGQTGSQPRNLLLPAESVLMPAADRRPRSLGPFSDPGTSLTIPLLLLGLLVLAARVWC